jgi:BirA family biotin operon repressor/biotin-[acetyl-CoA-carboxylase] ligase
MTFDIHKYKTLSSTQQQLRAMPDVRNGCVVVADFQTQGRGQQGTTWESEQGKNLLLSILIEPTNLPVANLFDLSRATALAIAHFLRDKKIDAKIKWANDIFVEDKKIAGILIEPTIRDVSVRQAIVGIGLNVNQLSFNLPRATSI